MQTLFLDNHIRETVYDQIQDADLLRARVQHVVEALAVEDGADGGEAVGVEVGVGAEVAVLGVGVLADEDDVAVRGRVVGEGVPGGDAGVGWGDGADGGEGEVGEAFFVGDGVGGAGVGGGGHGGWVEGLGVRDVRWWVWGGCGNFLIWEWTGRW